MLQTDLAVKTDNPTIYLKDYCPLDYVISKVDLDFKLGEDKTIVSANYTIEKTGEHQKGLVLDGEKLTLLKISLNDIELKQSDYKVDDASLEIAHLPEHFTLQIVTELQPHLNTELSGLYQSSGNFCTQCEAQGFRRISYFLDRPDVLSEYEVTIHADTQKYPVLLSNGNLVDHGQHTDGRHWAKWHDPHPKPSYLFALVAGDLEHITDQFVTASGKPIELNVYTQAHNIDKCEHAMSSLKRAMAWDEQEYGCEYDLSVYNIVAVDDFNMGAMENKGLNIFNSKYVLADQQSATDTDFQGIESVIGHEYFHNWSGNRVTCRDWFQLSLKEGFTVFRDQEFSADMGSRAVKRIQDVSTLRNYQFKEDAGPLAHPIRPESYQEINNFYTVTIYEKGAEVIRMLHSLVGANGFRAGSDLYFSRFDGQAATTEDFVQCMEQANSLDLSQFRLWFSQAGTPLLKVTQGYNKNSGVLELSMQQSCPATPGQADKKPLPLPIALALFDPSGNKKVETTVVMAEAQQRFSFEGLEQAPVVSLLRDFSAPVKLEFEQTNEELKHLIKYDDNDFVRYEAVQQLSLKLLLPSIRANSHTLDEAGYQNLVTALRSLLVNEISDKAILAEMLKLPTASYLAEQCKPIDPQCVVDLRQMLNKRIAKDLEQELLSLYQQSAQSMNNDFSLSAQAMAERALRNTVLSLLMLNELPEYYELAQAQYQSANNMTDRMAAFTLLLHSEYDAKQGIIEHFYQRWQDDSLVLDKWFAVQASTPSDDALQGVISLMSHSAFSMNNPNKVRSLVGSFTGNMRAFHRADGQGYQLLANVIIELNIINPQIGARLCGTFNNWRSFAEPYASNMKQQLERINEQDNLSKDVSEIIIKALN